ncbi:MAG: hypothetical protein ACREOG_22230 [Gemmatimonadaceae bacterium]
MRLSATARASIAGACHALGGVWMIAGLLRAFFGVAVTVPFLPPVDLARVAVGPSLLIGGALILFGAWMGRGARRATAAARELAAADRDAALAPPSPDWRYPVNIQDRERVDVPTPPA